MPKWTNPTSYSNGTKIASIYKINQNKMVRDKIKLKQNFNNISRYLEYNSKVKVPKHSPNSLDCKKNILQLHIKSIQEVWKDEINS